jgi:hypothetical protein
MSAVAPEVLATSHRVLGELQLSRLAPAQDFTALQLAVLVLLATHAGADHERLRHLAAVWVEGLLDMVAHYPAGAGR